jgi:hypothetical protein
MIIIVKSTFLVAGFHTKAQRFEQKAQTGITKLFAPPVFLGGFV